MKPHRLALTHSLVLHYGLYKKMIVSLAGGLGASCGLRAKWIGLNAPGAPTPRVGDSSKSPGALRVL